MLLMTTMHQSIQTVPTLILPCVIIFRGAGSGLQQHLQVEASRPNRTQRQRHSVRPPVTLWAHTGPNRYLPYKGQGTIVELVQPHSLCNLEEVTELPPVSETCAADRAHEHPLADGLVYHFLLWYLHHAPQSRIWSRFDWSFQWCRLELQVYFIRMLLHQRQLNIFNQAVHRRQFHCRAWRLNDTQQFQQPLILYTSCAWAAFKR